MVHRYLLTLWTTRFTRFPT